MAITIASGVDLSCSAEWGKLFSCSVDSDTAVACSAFASFLASKGLKIAQLDQVHPAPPPSQEVVARGALAFKRAAEVRKRPLASIEELEEEIEADSEPEAAESGSKRQKSKESSLVLLERLLAAFQAKEPIDCVASGSRMEKAAKKAAMRALNVNVLPDGARFTHSTRGEDGWLAGLGVNESKRATFCATVARVATLTAERLHACGGGSGAVKEMTVSWRDGSSKHHAQVWAWTGKALAERAAVCREMTASEVSAIRVCKGCGKVQSVHCGCMLVSGSLPLP
jgi:hypothetical protein